jgi:transcriptional regulator with XRE-family HTH domain
MTDLHAWKTSNKKSDVEIAEIVGVSQATISRIKNGKQKPSPDTAEKLSRLTGIPAWEFIKPDARQST